MCQMKKMLFFNSLSLILFFYVIYTPKVIVPRLFYCAVLGIMPETVTLYVILKLLPRKRLKDTLFKIYYNEPNSFENVAISFITCKDRPIPVLVQYFTPYK